MLTHIPIFLGKLRACYLVGLSSDSTRSLLSSLLSPIATKQISLPNITLLVAQEASFPVLSLILTD